MLNIFKSKRRELIEKKNRLETDFERADAERAAEIARLEADPDYRVYCQAIEVQRKIGLLQVSRRQAASEARQEIAAVDAEIRASADENILKFIRWAQDEKLRVSKEIVSKGVLERNRFGDAKGYITSNARKIQEHWAALDTAITAAQRLASSPSEDVAVELQKIRAALPLFEAQPERIDAPAALAAALR
jgi:hypothetical protein